MYSCNPFDATSPGRSAASVYYFADRYNLDNPYPGGVGGATLPGFNALSSGLTQLAVLSHTMTFGANAVNEARVSRTRLNNRLGTPQGGVGVSLADQGFSTGPTGIQSGFPKYTRLATGLPVTFTSFGDNSLMNIGNNGVNVISVDLPDVSAGDLGINHAKRPTVFQHFAVQS